MEQIIKQMAAAVIDRLDNLEEEADFERLLRTSDSDIRNDALELYQGLCQLREQLRDL